MAKKSGISLGPSEANMKRLNRASQAAAGVGEFESKGFEGFTDKLQEIGMEPVNEAIEKKKEETKKLEGKLQAGIEAFEAAGPGENEYNYGYDKVMDLREKILNTKDDKERASLMRDFNSYITGVKTQVESDKVAAKGFENFSMDKNENKSLYSSATDQRAVQLNEAFYNNKAEVFDGPDGEKMYRIELPLEEGQVGPPDFFQGTKQELDDMVVPKATEFDLAIGNLATSVKANAKAGEAFDADDIRRQIGNNLNTKDFKSLFADKLNSTGRSVIDDISSEIDNLTYKELLAPEDLAKFNIKADEGETNWYDNISPEDKEFMMKKIQEDENIGRSVLENYFFRFAEQQAGKGSEALESKSISTGKQSAIKAAAKKDELKNLGYGGTDKSVDDYLKGI